MSEEAIERAYNETWGAVDKLRKRFKKIYFFNINRDQILQTKPRRTTFAFDYAVARIPFSEVKKIEQMIKSYRGVGWTTGEDMMRRLDGIVNEITKYPHVDGYWR